MAADFKSHVLLRDEKGFFGIPFKRLLLAGVGGGLTYTFFNIAMPNWSIPAGAVLAVFVLVMTGTRGGLPLWQRLMYRMRGSLLLAAARDTQGLFGSLAKSLELPVELVRASRGKAVRAEPVAAVYEVGRVHHVGGFPNLETELTSWVPGESGWSPNRLDALVWAMTELLGYGMGARRAHRPQKRQAQTTRGPVRPSERMP